MVTLIVPNLVHVKIQGLGRRVLFSHISEKRVTRSVRDALRIKFGEGAVVVSCSAIYRDQVWVGSCSIHNVEHQYTLKSDARDG